MVTLNWNALSVSFGSDTTIRLADRGPALPSHSVQIAGPSGEGKTTMLAVFGGLLRPTSGTVRYEVNGATLSPIDARRRGLLAIQFQQGYVTESWTVRENIERFATNPASVAAALDSLGIADLEARKGRDLSGGEKRRVGLARALAAERPVLLVDEPLAELDDTARDGVAAALSEFEQQGGLLVLASHVSAAGLPAMDLSEVTKK